MNIEIPFAYLHLPPIPKITHALEKKEIAGRMSSKLDPTFSKKKMGTGEILLGGHPWGGTWKDVIFYESEKINIFL